jgi:hypothetical protein
MISPLDTLKVTGLRRNPTKVRGF